MTVVCSHVIPTTRMSFAIHEMGLIRGNVFSWEVIINENVNVRFFDWKPTLIKSIARNSFSLNIPKWFEKYKINDFSELVILKLNFCPTAHWELRKL